jgi:hypothetical protein
MRGTSQPSAETTKLKITLSKELYEKLERVGAVKELTPAVMARVFIAEAIQRLENAAKAKESKGS